jgi:transcriptional regulator with XRE-family HTH domain
MKTTDSAVASRHHEDGKQTERFRLALMQALTLNNYSQRELSERIGITIGTMTKYLKQVVPPFKVGLGIQRLLAKELGVTLDALVSYYESGEYLTGVTLADVEGWIRSTAGQEDLPALMKSMHEAALKAVEPTAARPQAYTWPIEALKEAGVSDVMRERLGLTLPALNLLATEGVFDDELVEAFALVTGHEAQAVRRAFQEKVPVNA